MLITLAVKCARFVTEGQQVALIVGMGAQAVCKPDQQAAGSFGGRLGAERLGGALYEAQGRLEAIP